MRDDLADADRGHRPDASQTTGSVPQGLDSQESGEQALAIVGIATVVLIVVLLAIIFRSVIICLMPILVVDHRVAGRHRPDRLGQRGLRPQGRLLDPDDPGRRPLRHRHRLHPVLPLPLPRAAARRARTPRPPSVHALERAGEAIASAGGAVIVAFMALLLSSLGIFQAIGPALAIAVARHPARRPDAGPGHRHRARPGALLAVEEVAQGARGRPLRQDRRRRSAGARRGSPRSSGLHPGRARASSRFSFNPSFDFDLEPARRRRVDRGAEDLPGRTSRPARASRCRSSCTSDDGTLDQAELETYARRARGRRRRRRRSTPRSRPRTAPTAQFSVVLDERPGLRRGAAATSRDPIRDAAHELGTRGHRRRTSAARRRSSSTSRRR